MRKFLHSNSFDVLYAPFYWPEELHEFMHILREIRAYGKPQLFCLACRKGGAVNKFSANQLFYHVVELVFSVSSCLYLTFEELFCDISGKFESFS